MNLRMLDPGPETIAILQRVLESAPAYSMAVTGAPAAPDAGRLDLEALPPDIPPADRSLFAIELGGEVIGWIDVVRGYPEPTTAFIGLFVLAEAYQRHGVGSAAYRELESIVASWGHRRLRLAVVVANAGADRFWELQGFRATGERKPYSCGTVTSETVIMEKTLGR